MMSKKFGKVIKKLAVFGFEYLVVDSFSLFFNSLDKKLTDQHTKNTSRQFLNVFVVSFSKTKRVLIMGRGTWKK